MAGLTEGDPANPPCTGEIGGEERRGRELARGFGEEDRLPKESSPSKRRCGGVLSSESTGSG